MRGISAINRQVHSLSLRPQRNTMGSLRPKTGRYHPPAPEVAVGLCTPAELFLPRKPEESPSLQKVTDGERRREQRKQQQHSKSIATTNPKAKVTKAQVTLG